MIVADPDGLLLPPIPAELERALRQLLQRQRGRVGPIAKLALHQGRGGALFVVVDEQRFCLDCWNEAGRPAARRYSDPVEAELQAQRSLERMMKRGGTHRHLARSGKA